jgi:Zn-dependent protease with chaperone function
LDTKKKIEADDFRLPKEKPILFGSLFILFIVFLIILKIHFLIPVFLFIFSAIWIKIKQKQLLGNSILVTEKTLPRIFKLSQIASQRLSMEMPDVFVLQSREINAYAIGVFGNKSVVLHSEIVKVMDDDELISIIGHEFSHIKCGHTIWNTITRTKEIVSIPVVSHVFEILFLYWSRSAEYTADRGCLIASGNWKATTSSFIKLTVGEELAAEVDVDGFIDQVKRERLITKISGVIMTHPYLADRIIELSEFFNSDHYKKLSDSKMVHDDHNSRQAFVQIMTQIKNNAKINIEKVRNQIKDFINTEGFWKSNVNIENPEKPDSNIGTLLADFNIPTDKETTPTDKETTPTKKETKPSEEEIKTSKEEVIPAENQTRELNVMSIFYAVLNEDLHEIKKIISLGVDPNIQDEGGDTPLHLAVRLESYEIAECLLKSGALIKRKNILGKTPLATAQDYQYQSLIELFELYKG